MTVLERHPEGWTYEDSDYSVGMFAAGWFHDDCEDVAAEDVRVSRYEGEGTRRTLIQQVRLSCPCGATVEVEYRSWDPDNQGEDDPWDV